MSELEFSRALFAFVLLAAGGGVLTTFVLHWWSSRYD